MATSPAELIYNLLTHAGQQGINHISKRADKAAGLNAPPALPQMPAFAPPPFPTMGAPGIPAIPTMQAMPVYVPMAMGAGVAAATPEAEKPSKPAKKTHDETTDSRDVVEGSYSDQVADGIACLACTRGHLNGLLAAIESATKAVDAGDVAETRRSTALAALEEARVADDSDAIQKQTAIIHEAEETIAHAERTSRQQYAMAAAEIDAMVAIDWAPDKLEASPPQDVAIIESVRECVMDIRAKIPTPEAISLALGSAKENVRFALSPEFTERDKAEIEARLRIIDKQGNALERGVLLEADDADSEAAATALRKARHTLDDAKAHDKLYTVGTHKQTIKDLEKAAIALTPTPDADQLDAVGQLCQSCSDTFYQAYFLLDPKKTPTPRKTEGTR